MPVPHIQVILGTTRPGRFSERVGDWLVDRLGQRDDLTVELLDLRDHPLPIYELDVAPARAGREYETPEVRRFGERLDQADGYVVVTGEYNHGYSSSLKNALDHVFPELHRKPITFAAYGQVGGARAVEQLRQVVVELEMAPLRHAVHILPSVLIAARQLDPFTIEAFAELDDRLAHATDDLVWWASALASARAEG
ncbi:NADPH-dependent FMN reductase [Aquihabitans sp. McL0605]|uniref:NADPH-dependent FMN reductase n=1 Tax=Aquihabitans sp. McL0605 TaxID=3415671 RepID=UPI003CEC868D